MSHSSSSLDSQLGECESYWLVSGPPFDQRDYMISPSDSASVLEDKCSSLEKKNKLRPSDIKIDSAYLFDSQNILKKLLELIKGGCVEHFGERLRSLINKYVQEFSSGFMIDDLPLIIEIVEYFSRNKDYVPEFEKFVKMLMCVAKNPPKIRKKFDILKSKLSVIEYFTLFGELLATFEDECFQHQLLQSLNCLIVRRKLVDVTSLKLSFCHEAMEESQLPYVIAVLMESVSSNLYIHYVDLALNMVLVSVKAGLIMIQNNVLDFLLQRLDPSCAKDEKINSEETLKAFEKEDEYYYKLLDKCGFLLWNLLNIIHKCDVDVQCPSENALWNLRLVFQNEARKGTQKAIYTRNSLAGIIVKLCFAFGERLPVIEAGLALDIVIFAVATEIGTQDTWASKIKLGISKEDYALKELMILCCCFLVKNKNAVKVLKSQKVIEGLLCLMNPKTTVPWIPSQFINLLFEALRALSVIVPALPEVFVLNNGNSRFLCAMQWFMEEHFDGDTLLETLKAFCSIVTCENNTCIIEDIRTQGGVEFLLDLCFYLIDFPCMKIEHQEKLSRVFVVLERLFRNEQNLQEAFKEQCVSISLKLLQRFLGDVAYDSKWNPKLFLSFGAFLWESVVWCEISLKSFIEKGGVFLLLDFIEMSSFPVQMFYLGILVDMTDQGETIAHLITWRGKCGYGVLNMMIDIWRKEENIMKVHRGSDGVILDVDAPLMTEEQWYLTHRVRGAHIYSPSVAEMVCSARPKIHALYQFLQQRYFALTQLGESFYCLQLKVVEPRYLAYIPLLEHYLALKMGEIWCEVFDDAHESGVFPTAIDGKLICTLMDEKNKWASRIKTMQEEILLIKGAGDANEEKKFYNFLNSCTLSSALEALRELDYVARTSFQKFQIQRKEKQINDVNKSLESMSFLKEGDAFDKNIHRTFLPGTKVTCFYDHDIKVRSDKEVVEYEDIQPVSPKSSTENYFDYNDEF